MKRVPKIGSPALFIGTRFISLWWLTGHILLAYWEPGQPNFKLDYVKPQYRPGVRRLFLYFIEIEIRLDRKL